jgi:hypothetical protein
LSWEGDVARSSSLFKVTLLKVRLIEFDFIPLHLHLREYPMSATIAVVLFAGIAVARYKLDPPKKKDGSKQKDDKKDSDKKPDSGGDKPKGEDGKKPDSGGDKPKEEDGKKPFSLSDIQGEMTLYVSTKKSKD